MSQEEQSHISTQVDKSYGKYDGKLPNRHKILFGVALGVLVTLFIQYLLPLLMAQVGFKPLWTGFLDIKVNPAPHQLYSDGDYEARLYKNSCLLCIETTIYGIYLGKSSNRKLGYHLDSGYGHHIQVPLDWKPEKGLQIEWKPTGAWLRFANGGRIWIPAHLFTGGR